MMSVYGRIVQALCRDHGQFQLHDPWVNVVVHVTNGLPWAVFSSSFHPCNLDAVLFSNRP